MDDTAPNIDTTPPVILVAVDHRQKFIMAAGVLIDGLIDQLSREQFSDDPPRDLAASVEVDGVRLSITMS